MKQVHKLESDPDGCLFDPRVRAAMTQFVLDDDTLALEAASAARAASLAVDRLRSHGTDSRGLSAGALDILLRLCAVPEDGMSIGDLAQAGGVSSRNVTGLVDTLERDGLARRSPDPTDRRSVVVRVTPAGEEWIESFRGPTQRAMSAIFRGFSTDELTQLRHLCLRLVDNQHRPDSLGVRAGGRAEMLL